MNQHPYYNMNMPYGAPYQQPQGTPMQGNPGMPTNYQQPAQPYQPYTGAEVINPQHMKNFCGKHKDYYVLLIMTDGGHYDGIVDKVDDENVYLIVPDGDSDSRYGDFGGFGDFDDFDDDDFGGFAGFGPGYGYGGGYGGYGGGYGGYGRYPRRFRRFRRFRFPFRRLARALLYPYFY